MGMVLRNPKNGEYYVVVIKAGDVYRVFSRIVQDGKLRTLGRVFECQTLADADKRCRSMTRIKRRKRGFTDVSPLDIPDMLAPFLEVPPDMQVTSEELLNLAREAQRERYVMMRDTTGLEDSFDRDVEYVAITTDDPTFLNVFDRYGKLVGCHTSRLSDITITEKAEEVRGLV